MDYFGPRMYDSWLGMFRGVDLHADRYASLSPYVYCGNNPMNFIDPTGMDSVQAQQSPPQQNANTTVLTLPLVVPIINIAKLVAVRFVSVVTWMATSLQGCNAVKPNETQATTQTTETSNTQGETQNNDDNDNKNNEPKTSEQKSIESLNKQVKEHTKKLDDYKRNPDKYDNKDALKNAPNQQIRDRIIQGRVRKLEKEISKFNKEIKKINGGQ